jgi:hypothetical protein
VDVGTFVSEHGILRIGWYTCILSSFLLGYKGTFTSKLSQRNRMFLHYRPRRSSEEVQKLTDSFLVANSESFSSKLPDPRKMVGRMRMQPSIASRRGRLWISPCRKDKENSTSAELIRSKQFNVIGIYWIGAIAEFASREEEKVRGGKLLSSPPTPPFLSSAPGGRVASHIVDQSNMSRWELLPG